MSVMPPAAVKNANAIKVWGDAETWMSDRERMVNQKIYLRVRES